MRSKSASYRIKVTNPECGPARVRKSSTRGGSAARRANAVAPSSELLPHFPYNETIMKSYFTLFTIYLIATGTALGAGSKTGGAALKSEQGAQPVQVYNQGIQLMHAKKFAEAQVKFEQALAENPNFAEAHNNLGYSLRKQGPQNYSKALEHYNKAIQLKPNLAEAYEYRGVLFLKMGRKVDAEKDLATLKGLKTKLANELEQVIQTGNEED
jgi:tetratricopeptide (TPR) repeat protein